MSDMLLSANLWGLYFAVILILLMIAYIVSAKKKTQLHNVMLVAIVETLIWAVTVMLEVIFAESGNPNYMIFENLTYIGSALTPIGIIFIGMVYAQSNIVFTKKIWALYIVPVITNIIVWTNGYHHLFYKSYDFINRSKVVLAVGPYFFFHTVYSYICMFIGLWFLIYFAVKNSGILSKQAILVILGSMIPIMVNLFYTFGIGNFDITSTPIAFSLTMLCFMLAVFQFNFMKIIPIAIQTVVDRISDSFVVVDDDLNIVDYNRAFETNFRTLYNFGRKDNLYTIIKKVPDSGINADELKKIIIGVKESSQTMQLERDFVLSGEERSFAIEITPIIARSSFIAAIILLKDITQSKRDFETIRRNQEILMERERLASLGQLIGGIAHNLRTPIMSVSGALEALKDLVQEYDNSVGDPDVTEKDYKEITGEMRDWITKIKGYISYMSDIISAVKGQTVQFNYDSYVSFTVEELVKRVDILMKHELTKHSCVLNKDIQIDPQTEIKGEVNSLVQIFDNMIVNSIHSYGGQKGVIELKITKDFGEEDSIIISLKDYAKGIPQSVQNRLFKEMVTTKGKMGTGLGLYISYSTIKGVFRGNMWYESKEGEGTEFFISLPLGSEKGVIKNA